MGKKKLLSSEVDKTSLLCYNEADVVNCDDLARTLVKTDWYNKVEQPLIDILFRMECRGIQLNKPHLERLKNDYGPTIEALRAEFGELNPNSPKQLQEYFVSSGVDTGVYSDDGKPSTEKIVLKRMAWEGYGFAKQLLSYREASKLYSTYICPLLTESDANGRIHGAFNQAGTEANSGGTATGRLTSSGPNLQNIPTRTESGKQVRKAFIASEGSFLIDSDLKQIEPRVLAHYTQSPKLLKAFNEGHDTHAIMAGLIFNKPIDTLEGMERFIGKTSWLASVYGAYPKKLKLIAETYSEEQPLYEIKDYERIQEAFWQANPEILSWRKRHIEETKRLGYITTLGGRRIHIPNLNSKNPWERQASERLSVNYLIQGSAADIMKLIILDVDKIKYTNLLATVHDEVLMETSNISLEDTATLADIIDKHMCNIIKLKNVPLEADTKIVASWGDK